MPILYLTPRSKERDYGDDKKIMAESYFHNRERAKQLIDFSGMFDGNLGCTDMDGVFEFRDKVLIIFEAKLVGCYPPQGQNQAFKRIIDAWEESGKRRGLYVIVEHNQPTEKDVLLRETKVIAMYTKGKWREVPEGIHAKELANLFLENYK